MLDALRDRIAPRPMKLYIWDEPYHVSYGHSMVFALARSLEEAREFAVRGKLYRSGIDVNNDWHRPPFPSLGEPTRILDAPTAEWHEWEE